MNLSVSSCVEYYQYKLEILRLLFDQYKLPNKEEHLMYVVFNYIEIIMYVILINNLQLSMFICEINHNNNFIREILLTLNLI